MGYQLLVERPAIKSYIQATNEDNKENIEKAALEVAKIWSSVGVPYATKGSKRRVEKNESYYSGGGDKASVSTEDVQVALKKLRANKDNLLDIENDNPNTLNDKSKTKKMLGIGLSILTIGITGTLIYLYLKKNNKLPTFMKNIKLK